MSDAGLELTGIRKRYGMTHALDGADLVAAPGEVLGVAGPNGAGKSTLVRIIGGEETADEGTARFAGAELHPERSVAVVHQEAQLFPNMTVGQNLMVGREGGRVMRPRVGPAERAVLEHLRLDSAADRSVESCSLALQQRVEIARALSREARIFLFDEPNSALTEDESADLFREMRRLADRDCVVLLVSHRLGDLVQQCDRVAIMRAGRVREVLAGSALSEEAIARALVVDVDPTELKGDSAGHPDPLVLRVRRWSSPEGDFHDVDLDLRAGSVTALTGVEGSGARELLRSLGGLERADGTFELDGVRRPPGHGVAYVPATRRNSLFDNFDVGQNLVVRQTEEIAAGSIVLRKRRMRALAEEEVRRFGVKTRSIFQGIRSLSGGNQQKVAIAAAIAAKPRVLLLEEPTRGVDLGSRQEIYRLLSGLAQSGCAVLIFCTETTEVFDAAARVRVVSRGRLLEQINVTHRHVEELAAELTALEMAGAATASRSSETDT
jgi:ABC-type sugar transport system ATPase subunit